MWLTTRQAAEHADSARQILSSGAAHITPSTIRQWASRGHLTGVSLGTRRPTLYLLADVARAELATRDRALRMVGIGSEERMSA